MIPQLFLVEVGQKALPWDVVEFVGDCLWRSWFVVISEFEESVPSSSEESSDSDPPKTSRAKSRAYDMFKKQVRDLRTRAYRHAEVVIAVDCQKCLLPNTDMHFQLKY